MLSSGWRQNIMKITGDFFTSQGPPKTGQIVEISDFQVIRHRLELSIERKSGNLILILGPRGIGKSTSLEYSREYVNDYLDYDCARMLNIGLHIPQLLEKQHKERITFVLKEIALALSDGKTDDITTIIEILNQQTYSPYFLFIDNLDRLYQSQDDLVFVKSFFQLADPALKELSKKVVIVISCAPEWSEFLEKGDLSYLNFSNSINLEPLSEKEIRQLIESRANAQGLEIDKLITKELIPVLKVASRGNPRSVFQFLEKIFNKIDESQLPVDVLTFQNIIGIELHKGIIEKMKIMSSKSPNLCWGINQLWRYFDILQKSGGDYVMGVDKLIKCHENSYFDESKINLPKSAWSRVIHKNEFGKLVLNSPVRDLITKLYKETKIEKEILLTAYSENLFMASTTIVEDYIDKYKENTNDIESALTAFNDSLDEYYTLISLEESEDRIKFIKTGWNCLKQLMLTLIAIEEGDVPKELSLGLENKSSVENSANELENNIASIYKEFRKVNPYRTEISSVKERFLDVINTPEVVRYWDTEQMKEFERQVLNSYEGLLRGLNPSDLKNSEKRNLSDILSAKIENGEDFFSEFKSSIGLNHEAKKDDFKKPVLKTIVAFLNSDGGKLIIGVNDNKEIIGIEKDITVLQKGIDGYQQHIMNIVDSYIGSSLGVYLKISFPRLKGYTVAVISVTKSPYPVYLKYNSSSEFYIRSGNTTRKLEGNELDKYTHSHWKSRV